MVIKTEAAAEEDKRGGVTKTNDTTRVEGEEPQVLTVRTHNRHAQHSTAQHSTAQHSTAQHDSTAQHSTPVRHSRAPGSLEVSLRLAEK